MSYAKLFFGAASLLLATGTVSASVITIDQFDFDLSQFDDAEVTTSGSVAFFGSDFDNSYGLDHNELGELVSGTPGDRITLGITQGEQGILTLDYGMNPFTVGSGGAFEFIVYEANGEANLDPEGTSFDISFDSGMTWVAATPAIATTVDPDGGALDGGSLNGVDAASHNQIVFDVTNAEFGFSIGDIINEVMIRNQIGNDTEHDPDFVFAAFGARAIPMPTPIALTCAGLLGVACIRRRR